MRYLPIDNTLFVQNRKRLAGHLKPESVAVLNSNDIMPKNADGAYPFVQNTDLFFLSGIDQEESILLISPDAREEKHREILFIRETNEKIAIWEGQKLTKEDASKISGVKTVYWTKEFKQIIRQLVFESRYIYLNTNEHLRADVTVETRDMRFLKWCRTAFPLHKYERLAPIMHLLRAVKLRKEVMLIKQAIEITGKAFERMLGFIKPGRWEFEIEAEMVHEFLGNRSQGSAFAPIIASGADSCVLHYVKNNKKCKKGDILLMDFGAEYANYAADITRTVPVSGKFNRRQKRVYMAVLKVQKQAIQMLTSGNTFDEYQKAVGKLMEIELISLGLLNAEDVKNQEEDNPIYKKYFMHGISHHMGLDVHDYGSRYGKFEDGMVFTCEPGIYIPEEKIGIRLENNILITKKGPKDLSADIPIEPEEIEEIMNR